jgi:hypothetical protein
MTEQLLIDLGNRSPDLQLNLQFPEVASPVLVSDEEYETLWNRVNRICDQYLPTQRERRAA